MKTYYTKIDQYLLENYPTIWNTKIVWVLLVNLMIHILFFLIGFFSHSTPESLQTSNVVSDYFTEGLIFVNLIISLLITVVWLVMMFKNNSFKNFYPNSNSKLFFQFFQYFIIFLTTITFYYSYMAGFKTFIETKYDVVKMNNKIKTINKAIPFLPISLEDYTLDNRKFPKVFSDLYCETNEKQIEGDKKFYTYLDRNYQFFTTYSKTVYKKNSLGAFLYPEPEKTNKTKLAYKDEKQNSITYYFKKEVVDLDNEIITSKPSFYNFSGVFYYRDDSNNTFDSRSYDINYNIGNSSSDSLLKKESFNINKSTVELLKKNNSAEIKELLSQFLEISKEFNIKTNLDSKSWYKLIYQPNNFEVKYFIKNKSDVKSKYYNYQYSQNYNEETIAVVDSTAATIYTDEVEPANEIVPPSPRASSDDIETPEDFFKANLTDYYYESENLKTLLRNIDEVRSSSVFTESIHILLWVAFILSTLIFSYRITSLRVFLFSAVTSGVLMLVIIILSLLSSFILNFNYSIKEFFTLYLLWLIGAIILLSTIFGQKYINKTILGILLVIVINGILWYVLLHFGIIDVHQKNNCDSLSNCETIFEEMGGTLISFICLILSFIFMYFYTSIIQKWRALPA